MAKTLVNSNITITFSTLTGDGNIQIELDDVLNNEKSQFGFGDVAHFKVYTSPLDMEFDCYCSDPAATFVPPTAGNVVQQAITDEDNVNLSFIDTDESNISYPCNGGLVATRWFGNNWGPLSLIGDTVVRANRPSPALPLTQSNACAICRVNYNTEYHPGSVSVVETPGEAEWPVIIYVIERGL
jgi:hypothetical protein